VQTIFGNFATASLRYYNKIKNLKKHLTTTDCILNIHICMCTLLCVYICECVCETN